MNLNRVFLMIGTLGLAMALLPATAAAQGVLYVVDDNVGIGTDTPTDKLEVVNPTGNASLRFDSSASANFWLDRGNMASLSRFVFLTNAGHRWSVGMINDGTDDFHFTHDTVNDAITIKRGNRYVGFGNQKNPAFPIHHSNGAHLTPGGAWTDASSRAYKENIKELGLDEALEALAGLSPVRFNYKLDPGEESLGFIAEDVPALVATQGREGLSPMDLIAVLTRVVQEQQRAIERQNQLLSQQNGLLQDLREEVDQRASGR